MNHALNLVCVIGYLCGTAMGAVLGRAETPVHCVQGVCTYALPLSSASLDKMVILSGGEDVLSDLGPASAWRVLDCAPAMLGTNSSTSLRVRLLCTGGAADCKRLSSGGMVDTIARLPDCCGPYPIARVASMLVSPDQSLPAEIAAELELQSRVSDYTAVQELMLDTDFAKSASSGGPASFVIIGSSIPGLAEKLDLTDAIVQNTQSVLQELLSFSKGASISLPPLHIAKDATALNETVACAVDGLGGTEKASVAVNIGVVANAAVNVGFVASGTLIPPKLNAFSVSANLSMDINGSLAILSDTIGELDSGLISLFTEAFAGLDIPGVLSFSPSFEVSSRTTAVLGAALDLDVAVEYTVKNLQVAFSYPSVPQNRNPLAGEAWLSSSHANISAAATLVGNTSIVTHLIPSLNINISAFSGAATAQLALGLDAAAAVELGAAGTIATVSSTSSTPQPPNPEACAVLSASLSDSLSASALISEVSAHNSETHRSGVLVNETLFERCFSPGPLKRSASSGASPQGPQYKRDRSNALAGYASLLCAPAAVERV